MSSARPARYLAALLLLFLAAPLGRGLAQEEIPGTIRGHVVERDTGKPIQGARVVLESAAGQALTDSSGTFHLDVGNAREARLHVLRVGYARLDTLLAPVPDGSDVTLGLDPVPVPLLPLTVRAAMPERGGPEVERALFDRETVPGAIGISRQELRAIPVVAEPDVLRSLQALPGVVAVNDLSAQLHVRGGGPDQNLFLFDGARVLAPYHLFGLFGAFNPDAVGRVEFFRGVLPARYSGALSSVVDLDQIEGTAEQLRVEGGASLLGARALVRGPVQWGGGRWLVAGRRTHADLVASGDAFPYAFHDLQGRLTLHPTPHQRVRASFFTSADRFRWFRQELGKDLASSWRNAVGSVRWDHARPSGWSASALLWGSTYFGDLATGQGDEVATTRNETRLGGLTAELVRRGEASGLRLGTNVEVGEAALLGPESGGYFLGEARGRYALPAAYVEGEQWIGRLRLAPGVRVAFQGGADRVHLEPRMAARLHLSEDAVLTVGASRTHQLLSTLQDDRYVVPGAPLWFIRPDSAPPARTDGLHAAVETWHGRAWSFNLEAYLRHFEGMTRWRPSGRRDLATVGFDEGEARGVEMTIRRHAGPVTGWLGYGLSSVSLTHATEGQIYSPAWDRRHSLDAALFAELARVSSSIRLVYGSGLPFWPPAGEFDGHRFDPARGQISPGPDFPIWADEQARLPGYLRLDLSARYRFRLGRWEVEPYASVLNVTNHQNVLFYEPRSGADPARAEAILVPRGQIPRLPLFGVDARFDWRRR